MTKRNSQWYPLWKHYSKALQPKSLSTGSAWLACHSLHGLCEEHPFCSPSRGLQKSKDEQEAPGYLLLSAPINTGSDRSLKEQSSVCSPSWQKRKSISSNALTPVNLHSLTLGDISASLLLFALHCRPL